MVFVSSHLEVGYLTDCNHEPEAYFLLRGERSQILFNKKKAISTTMNNGLLLYPNLNGSSTVTKIKNTIIKISRELKHQKRISMF